MVLRLRDRMVHKVVARDTVLDGLLPDHTLQQKQLQILSLNRKNVFYILGKELPLLIKF
jgi:hypothetical protein